MNDIERIGNMIKSMRQSRGLSVRELADKVGITYQSLSKIENGKYNTGIGNVCKIASALGCKVVLKKIDTI